MGTPTNDAESAAASRAPNCVAAVARQRAVDAPLTLVQLVECIETLLWDAPSAALEEKHSILERALTSYSVDMRELQPFALFDPSRNYTRNIISTDYETYTLLLLCWNRGHYSPIHDHTSTGCWIKAIQGEVHEIRYARDGDRFVETSNVTYTSGVTYMDDQLGCHRVGNPRDDLDAITMHLYTPPYRACHTWLDASDARRGVSAIPTFYSKFGKLTP